MDFVQRIVRLKARPRGCHVVTRDVLEQLPELRDFEVGFLQLFIQHTSASLTINENVSPDVRRDLEEHLNHLAPENAPYYEHTIEGADDMPAHLKASLLGSGLTIPVGHGELLLGTWQGVYLCEHRNHGGPRQIVVTLFGQRRTDRSKS
ncbi:MAG TPA: secondary thiamine-phosphate synthase enzyme YjbQ [Blastocatellia bacterium]|nr:secondary thiamine-phosphate synthase enzyme YjbQ [Blastocatellia bacterium]